MVYRLGSLLQHIIKPSANSDLQVVGPPSVRLFHFTFSSWWLPIDYLLAVSSASFVYWPLDQNGIVDNGIVMARRPTSIMFYNGFTATFIIASAPRTIIKTFHVASHKGKLKRANDVTDLFNKQGMRHSDTVQCKVMVAY